MPTSAKRIAEGLDRSVVIPPRYPGVMVMPAGDRSDGAPQPVPETPFTDLRGADSAAELRAELGKDAVRGSLWILTSSTVMIPMTFLVSLVVAHALGVRQYGRLAVYVSAFSLTVTVLNAGISEASVQWVARAHARGDRAGLLQVTRLCAAYHWCFEAPAVFALTLALLHDHPAAAVVAGLANAATMLLGTSAVLMTAMARNALSARVGLVVALTLQTTLASSALAGGSAAVVWAAQTSVSVLAPLLLIRAHSPDIRRAILRPTLPRGWPPGMLRYAMSAWGGAIVATLVVTRTELFVLQANHLPVAAGLFALAGSLAGQVTLPINALMGPLVPVIAGIYASAPERAAVHVQRALRLSGTLGMLAAALVLPAALVLLPTVYGQGFAGAVPALYVLGLVSCLQSVIHPLTAFAFATRSAAAVLRINLVALVVDIGLALTLIPVIGLGGAVVANACAQVISLGLLVRLLAKQLHISFLEAIVGARTFLLGVVVVGYVVVVHEVAGGGLVAGVVTLVGCLTIVLGASALFPGLRLAPNDLDVVRRGLPGRLSQPFEGLVRVLLLEDAARPRSTSMP